MKIIHLFLAILFISPVMAQETWSIEKCINYAVENNLSIINSQSNEELLKLQEKITQNEKLPTVSANFNNSFDFGFQPTISGVYEYAQSYSNNWSIGANVLLYNKGRLDIQNQKAALDTEIQTYNTEELKQNTSLQIANFYLQIVLNKELITVAQDQLENSNTQLSKTQKLYNAGAIPLSTLVEQKAQNATDNYQVQNAIINEKRARFVLANYLQIEDYTQFEVKDVSIPSSLTFDALNVSDIIEFAYGNRPEIKRAEKQIESAEKDIDLAKTAFFPSVSAGYQLGTRYFNGFDSKEDFLDKQWYDNHNQNVYVNVSIPIFNKGNTRLNVQRAQMTKNLVSQNIEIEKLQLEQNIQTAYFDAEAAYQSYENLKNSFEAAKKSENFAQKSFNAGRISIYDFNVIKTNAIVAQSQMLQAKYDCIFKLKVLDFYAGKEIDL